MTVYVKPNGTEVDVSDKSVAYAESLGWTEKGKPAVKKAAKKKAAKQKED
tara:strand:- start:411 stop:560 length:150 start_codon:yes stop_codon:yes gene_type:complete